jgi:hypothetical protein
MAGVDPMDVCLDSDPGTINLRIDLHPEAVITPATVDEIRKHFHFLRAVTATLELKSRSYEGYDLEKTINQIMRNEYLAYLDRVKEPTTPVAETRIVQYDLPPEFPVSVRKHLNRFYNEKAMTMEEAERFQAFNIFTYRYVGGRFRSIYFEEPDIRAVLQKYSYNDKYFNPVKNPETAEISDTGNSTIPLIQWTANNADFAELITELLRNIFAITRSLISWSLEIVFSFSFIRTSFIIIRATHKTVWVLLLDCGCR